MTRNRARYKDAVTLIGVNFLKKTYITILNNRFKLRYSKTDIRKTEIDKFTNIIGNFKTPFVVFARIVDKNTVRVYKT